LISGEIEWKTFVFGIKWRSELKRIVGNIFEIGFRMMFVIEWIGFL
jgi:hypothetical protein